MPIDEIDEILGDVIDPNTKRLIYSSRSATAENKKWRALVPLAARVSGADFRDVQNAFFDCLEQVSAGLLIPDRALARPGQLVFLPNRGDHYEFRIVEGDALELTADCMIEKRRAGLAADRAKAEREAKEARERRIADRKAGVGVVFSGETSPVDAFAAAHRVADLLERYGYTRDGQSNDWRSPMQESGSYATRDYGGYWISLSASDAAAGIGAATKDGYRHGDAFDLYVHYEHGGDFTAALRAYAEEIRPSRSRAGDAEQSDDAGEGPDDTPEGDEGHEQPSPTSDGEPRPNTADEIDLSQDALATEMGRRGFDLNARYVAAWGKWLFWDGTRWRIDTRLAHLTRTREFLRTRAFELQDWAERKAAKLELQAAEKILKWAEGEARTLRSKNTVAAVEALARGNAPSVAAADDFDADRLLLGTPGGTVDLRTGKMRQPRREDSITKLTAVAPKSGTPKRWLQFLHEVFDGDSELVAFMQRAAGYALTGETREHKLLFLYGTGRNGKSTFLNLLYFIWGEYARRAHASAFLNASGDKHPTDIAGLQGARLVAASELPKGKTWDEAVIKDLTGGDTMTARFMRGDFFDFDPHLTLMIAGNNQPSFRGVDEAIRARVVLVPFTVTIPPERRDPHLEDKLRAEAPQILAWAIEGAVEWQTRGLDVPASVSAASAEYFDDEDITGQFLADTVEPDPEGFINTTELYRRFVQWCEVQNLSPWTMRGMQKEVKARGYPEARRKYGRGFAGMRFR